MGVQVIADYQDPNYLPEQTPEYKLSVLIGVDSLCFEVVESRSNRSLILRDYPFSNINFESELFEVFENDQILLNSNYQAVRIGLCLDKCTLVPLRFFNPLNISEYWDTVSGYKADQQIRSDSIPTLDATLLYTVPLALLDRLTKIQPRSRVFYSASAWLTTIQQISNTTPKPSVFVHLHANQGFVGILDSGSLLFFNRFIWQTAKDFLYFTLLALDQSGLQLDTTRLILSGKVTPDSEICQLLQRYFPDNEMASAPLAVNFPADFPKAHSHWYFDLTSFRWF